ncbi:MAG: smalltalk protein, partial [Bacteroides sp.]|nr:smalltalk protein [Bacteroides sp.]
VIIAVAGAVAGVLGIQAMPL